MTTESVTKPAVECDPAGSERAYIGLGSNLCERHATIGRALEFLDQVPGIEVTSVSTLRETDPVGFERQPPFVNGACALQTSLSARGLLDALLAVETRLGRTRDGVRWGPRIIDLDLLLFGAHEVDEPGLSVPHPRLHQRAFVLEPLLDLDPTIRLPDGRRVKDLLSTIK